MGEPGGRKYTMEVSAMSDRIDALVERFWQRQALRLADELRAERERLLAWRAIAGALAVLAAIGWLVCLV